MTEAYDHLRVIRDTPTSDLLDTYRHWPTADVQRELESRGVVLWHHGLKAAAR